MGRGAGLMSEGAEGHVVFVATWSARAGLCKELNPAQRSHQELYSQSAPIQAASRGHMGGGARATNARHQCPHHPCPPAAAIQHPLLWQERLAATMNSSKVTNSTTTSIASPLLHGVGGRRRGVRSWGGVQGARAGPAAPRPGPTGPA